MNANDKNKPLVPVNPEGLDETAEQLLKGAKPPESENWKLYKAWIERYAARIKSESLDPMKYKIPTEFMGVTSEDALKMFKAGEAPDAAKMKTILEGLEAVESSLTSGKSALVPSPVRTVVLVSLGMGALCIASAILRSWLGTPVAFDWGILFAGVVLCGLSLFQKFKIGREGVSATMKDVVGALHIARTAMHCLTMPK